MKTLLLILTLLTSASAISQNIPSASTITFVDSLPGLQNIPRERGGSCNVLGYYYKGDGGGDIFYWDDTATMSPVQGMVVQVTGVTTGRWKRRHTGNKWPLQDFGGRLMTNVNTDTITDNILCLRIANQWIYAQSQPNYSMTINNSGFQSTGGNIVLSAGFWRVTDSIHLLQGVNIEGDDKMGTTIVCDMENKVNFTRTAGYRSFIICYGGGSGGTSFPLVISNSFGDNHFYNISITSTYATGGGSTPFHWTTKNFFELRNGFYGGENVSLNGADSNGVYSFSLIQSTFIRWKIDNCGQNAWYMTKDPANPTNPTTTTVWIDGYFRTARRGDGFYCDGPIISSSFVNCIWENNGIEDSAGYGFHSLGDSTFNMGRLGWSHYTQQMIIAGGDFERNTAGKLNIDWCNLSMTGVIRYTGQPSGNNSDWFVSNSLWNINTSSFQSNVNPVTGVPSIIIRSNDSTRSSLDIAMPNMTVNNIAFIDSPGTVHPYQWMPYLTLRCVRASGVGRITYLGFTSTLESGFFNSYKDSTMIDSASLIGTTSPSTFLLGADSLIDAGTKQFRLKKIWSSALINTITTADNSLINARVGTSVDLKLNTAHANTWSALQTYILSTSANTTTTDIANLNTAAATSGNQSYSGNIRYEGQAFNTATSATTEVGFMQYTKPIQGTSVSGQFILAWDTAGGGYSNLYSWSTGGLSIAPMVEGSTTLLGGIGSQLGSTSLGLLYGLGNGIGFQRASGGSALGAEIDAIGESAQGADLAFTTKNPGGTTRHNLTLIGNTGNSLFNQVIDDGNPYHNIQDSLSAVIGDTLTVSGRVYAPNIPGEVNVVMAGYDSTTGQLVKCWGCGAGPVTLAKGSVTNAATMPINFAQWVGSGAGTYTHFQLFIDVIPLTNNVTLEMETSANGTVFDNAAFDYYWQFTFKGGGTNSTNAANDNTIQMGGNYGDSTAMHSTGIFWMINPSNTSNHPNIKGTISEYTQNPSSNGVGNVDVTAFRRSAAAMKGVTIFFSTGNITGNWYLVGYP